MGPQTVHKVLPHLKNSASIHKDKPQLNLFNWKNDPFIPSSSRRPRIGSVIRWYGPSEVSTRNSEVMPPRIKKIRVMTSSMLSRDG